MGTRKSITQGQHKFSEIPSVSLERSQFNRSCGLKTTFDSGFLIPIFCDEALPGDTMSLRMSSFARLATPLHPVMDNMYMDFFFFAVPNRLLWDNWQKFMGEQEDPGDSTDFMTPVVPMPVGIGAQVGSLADYMGVPTDIADLEVSAFWFRAYALIYNEWFRDQNLVPSVSFNTDDGPDDPSGLALLRRNKRHDYFTSCLPWPQKADSVELPLGSLAPVIPDLTDAASAHPKWSADNEGLQTLAWSSVPDTVKEQITPAGTWTSSGELSWNDSMEGHHTGLVTDLSLATSATINAIRQAFQIQRLYERDARGGTRYTEILRSHFGVTSPDQRLQRPEYLGGGTANIMINPVPQTSEATDPPATTPQGNLAGYGTSQASGIGFQKSFVEHCVILGLVSVRADLNYQQGLSRMYSRRTRWDYFWPALAHLGEQAVLNKEIYAQNTAADDNVFGYQERYAEYRYKPSNITGQFRSTFAQTLDSWHLAQEFVTLPILGEIFIRESPPISRIVAVPSEPEFLFDAYFDYKCARPMPLYSVPGMIDHF